MSVEQFHSRPHHALQEAIRGPNRLASLYLEDPVAEARNKEAHALFWTLPPDTEIIFSVDGTQDPRCQICPRHPDRHATIFTHAKIAPIACDIERTNSIDRKILQVLQRIFDHGPITLGDIRTLVLTDEGDMIARILLRSDFPQDVLDRHPHLQNIYDEMRNF